MKTPVQDLLKQIAPLPYLHDGHEHIQTQEHFWIAETHFGDDEMQKATAAYLVHAANTLPKVLELLKEFRHEHAATMQEASEIGYSDGLCFKPSLFTKLLDNIKQASEVEV